MNTSENQYAPEPADATTPTSTRPEERRILTGTVVWGGILLVFAALYGATAAADLDLIDVTLSPAWIILGVGALFVVGGLIAAIGRRK
jgi:hypothetical protein